MPGIFIIIAVMARVDAGMRGSSGVVLLHIGNLIQKLALFHARAPKDAVEIAHVMREAFLFCFSS